MPKKKKTKKVKKVKSVKKTKNNKIKKTKIEDKSKKQTNLNQEEKPEIKKIKKQATEKRVYNLKDYVVYPKHGVGKITSIEKATIGEIDIHFYKIHVEKEKLTLTVPINLQSKLRPISAICPEKLFIVWLSKCISFLKNKGVKFNFNVSLEIV